MAPLQLSTGRPCVRVHWAVLSSWGTAVLSQPGAERRVLCSAILSRQGAEGPVLCSPGPGGRESLRLWLWGACSLGPQLQPPFCSLPSLPTLEKTGQLCSSVFSSSFLAACHHVRPRWDLWSGEGERPSPQNSPPEPINRGTGRNRGPVFSSGGQRGTTRRTSPGEGA